MGGGVSDTQRLVNCHQVALEPPGDVKFTYESIPGLTVFATLSGEARGAIETNDRVFVVFGSNFCELMASGSFVVKGSLSTSSGPVSMAYGLSQVVLVDGDFGYVFRLDTNVLGAITSDAFYGSPVVKFIDNVFLFIRPDTQQFYISAINDASSLDALDFASAESQPDNLITLEVDHSEIYLFGQYTTEIWFNAGLADFPFQRSQGSGMEVGCMAAHSVRQIDNSIFWLGRDKSGAGIIYRAVGHQPQRISNHDVERDLQASDSSAAVAYVYQDKGLTFYCINAPGMKSTWCYEVSSGRWHERCELDSQGFFKALRSRFAVFAFGKHLQGADDGCLYLLDSNAYKLGNDPLVREITTPRLISKSDQRTFFRSFWVRMTTGQSAQGEDPEVELSWTDDAGKTWCDPKRRSVGKIGEVFAFVRWLRVGASFDRAWKLRFAGNAPFSVRDLRPDV